MINLLSIKLGDGFVHTAIVRTAADPTRIIAARPAGGA
jgi:hypothetical protein